MSRLPHDRLACSGCSALRQRLREQRKTPHLLHNGCENCHGPGSRHIQLIEAGDKDAANKEIRLTLADAKKSHCVTCHDLDNDPHFNSEAFDSYWEKIKHIGRD